MENLKALVNGREISQYQRALALQEFNALLKTDRFNLNHKVIIYPNKSGWRKIKALIASKYLLSYEEADRWINARKTSCGGYEEQLWVLIRDIHDMFYNGQTYLANTWINLKHE